MTKANHAILNMGSSDRSPLDRPRCVRDARLWHGRNRSIQLIRRRPAVLSHCLTTCIGSECADRVDVRCLLWIFALHGEKCRYALDRDIRGQPLETQREHIRVVPAAGVAGDPRLPSQRGSHARHLVRRDRGPGARPAHHNAEVRIARRDRLTDLASAILPRGTRRDLDLGDAAQVGEYRAGAVVLVVGAEGDLHIANRAR